MKRAAEAKNKRVKPAFSEDTQPCWDGLVGRGWMEGDHLGVTAAIQEDTSSGPRYRTRLSLSTDPGLQH